MADPDEDKVERAIRHLQAIDKMSPRHPDEQFNWATAAVIIAAMVCITAFVIITSLVYPASYGWK